MTETNGIPFKEDAGWYFTMPIEESHDGEILDRYLRIFETTMATFEGFVEPRAVHILVDRLPRRLTLEELIECDYDERVRITLESSSSGIECSELTGAIQASRGGPDAPKRVTKIYLKETSVRFQLEHGDSWLDRSSEAFAPDIGKGPSPVRITVGCFPSTKQYSVMFHSHTDIWFEDSAIGAANRERLATSLSDIAESMPWENIDFDSDYLSEWGLSKRGYDELVFD